MVVTLEVPSAVWTAAMTDSCSVYSRVARKEIWLEKWKVVRWVASMDVWKVGQPVDSKAASRVSN